jgi:DNA-directed RNA polymerase sigma subunit (sigma70/sigma32)
VKIGTTDDQKRLFLNLSRAKSRISALNEGDLRPDQAKLIALRFGVTDQQVIDMDRRLLGDASLTGRRDLPIRRRRTASEGAARSRDRGARLDASQEHR